LSGLLVFLSFPPVDLGPLAFVAFVPLLVALARVPSYGSAALCGAVAAAAAYLPAFAWIASVAIPGWLAVALYVGLYLVGVSAIVRFLQRQFGAAWPLLAAFLWAGQELFRARLGPGFPWLFIGYTQYKFSGLLQIAAWGGVYSVSFVVFLVDASVAAIIIGALCAKGRRKIVVTACVTLAAAVGLVAACGAAGSAAKERVTTVEGPVVGVIQQNIPRLVNEIYSEKKTLEDFYRERQDEVQTAALLTAGLRGTGVRLAVWPESTVSVPLNLRPEQFAYTPELPLYEQAVRLLSGLGKEMDCCFLVGAPSYVAPTVTGSVLYGVKATEEFRNSAVFLSSDGRFLGRYDKIHLVPFGEYIPLRRALPFLQALTPIPREITASKEEVVFSLPSGGAGKGVRFSALVCYEDVFPDLCANFRRKGAQFLVNVTDEGWYHIPGELRQHLAMAVFRAVETRTTVVRAANTGISCFINPRGEVYAALKPLTHGQLSAPVQLSNDMTPYVKHGDAFGIACLMLAIFLPPFLIALSGRSGVVQPKP
jgi:apolipoprotein N-acyltransferase